MSDSVEKALSIKQPWASLIAHGIKDIENRTWRTNFRGRIYIHASGQMVKHEYIGDIFSKEQLNYLKENNFFEHIKNVKLSAIIGEVDIVDCTINHESIWAEKTPSIYEDTPIKDRVIIYNWVLANPVLYDEPILNVKGKLSFWKFESIKL